MGGELPAYSNDRSVYNNLVRHGLSENAITWACALGSTHMPGDTGLFPNLRRLVRFIEFRIYSMCNIMEAGGCDP